MNKWQHIATASIAKTVSNIVKLMTNESKNSGTNIDNIISNLSKLTDICIKLEKIDYCKQNEDIDDNYIIQNYLKRLMKNYEHHEANLTASATPEIKELPKKPNNINNNAKNIGGK
ncbi:hypothetical protein CAXC1_320028 [Candidatus Xenohaliotis californiensis]|uniref:Uncharacterized protein n=1 Tax=Candidatus Xenohaliotis californiensis TaxID=84677 RepID=A0ABP0EWF7_9RICK|nr:hypothetical protein CAXC1_320028 [Candidatus Xenohaliotis californiensis]